MKQEKKSFKEWCKEHKTGLIVASSVVVATGIGIASYCLLGDKAVGLSSGNKSLPLKGISIKGVESINAIPANASDCVSNPIKEVVTRIPHDVSGHPRNLPDGWHASINKLEEAKAAGIQLLDGQTYVKPYSTGKNMVA